MSKNLNHLFKEFTTEEDAKKWAKENYGQWLNDIQITEYTYESKNLNDLLYGYTGDMYLIYNRMLRGTEKYDSEDEETEEFNQRINIINNEISKFNLKENVVVWRYTYKELLKLLFEKQKIKVGHTFTDKAFIDTTLVPDLLRAFAYTHRYNCLLKLYLPKGTKGVYVEFYHENDYLNECEFLLPLNTTFVLKRKYFSFRYMKTVYECYLVAQE
ncbi:MAG: hypothetical protein E7206_03340 [Clostridium beijerinckii]|nr:hypothetical protein [Clostridium beijerinckii]